MDLRVTASEVLGDAFIGIAWEGARGWLVFYEPGTVKGAPAALRKALGLESGQLRVVPVPGGVPAVQHSRNLDYVVSVQEELAELGAPKHSLDERCGLLEIGVLSSANTRSVEDLLLEGIPNRNWFELVEITEEDLPTPDNRGQSEADYVGGKRLQIASQPAYCTASLGFYKDLPGGGREWWGVTAAHCLPDQLAYTSGAFRITTQQWRIGGVDIGVVPGGTANYYVYGGPMDLVVTQLNRPVVDRHYIRDAAVDTFTDLTWWQWHVNLDADGDTVCQSGQATNQIRCGSITDRNAGYWLNSNQSKIGVAININGIREAEFTSTTQGGDSGGSVWHVQSSSTSNLAGVHHGSNDTYFYYTHASYLLSTFGLTSVVECDWAGTC